MNVCDARVIMLKKKVALKIVGHFGHMWRECRLLDGSPHSQTFHLNLSSKPVTHIVGLKPPAIEQHCIIFL